jgi:hypothetical protein
VHCERQQPSALEGDDIIQGEKMSEQTDPVSSGGHDGPLHFLRPGGRKVGLMLLILLGMAALLFVATCVIPGQGGMGFAVGLCWGLGTYLLARLVETAFSIGGWPWGL